MSELARSLVDAAAEATAIAIDCVNCVRYVAAVPDPDGGAWPTYEYERDGFTISNRRHVCAPRSLIDPYDMEDRHV